MLFGLTNRNMGQYYAVDARTGKIPWMQASQTAFEPLRRYKVVDADTWAQPAISGNRIFVKDVSTLTLWTLG